MVNMTEEQKVLARKYIKEFDKLFENNNLDDIENLLDEAMLDSLDPDYEPTNTTRELIKLYDEIYTQN